MSKVAVIGAGVFGCSIALELDKRGFDVTLFEQANEICSGATTHNHLRHHYGYHYPRSKSTAIESIKGRGSFEKEYGSSIIECPSYFAVARKNSKSTESEIINFCFDLGLKYSIIDANKSVFNPAEVTLCFKANEPAYSPEKLRKIIYEKIKQSKVNLRLGHEITGGKIVESKKTLKLNNKGNVFEEDFDFVVAAVYVNFNKVNEWFGFPKKKVEYAIMELLDVELPIKEHFSAMVVDGDFATFVPSGEPGVVRLGHVKEVVLKKVVAEDFDPQWLVEIEKISNKEKILSESMRYYPFLKDAKFIKSVFCTRIAKANVEATDERPSEITNYGRGIYSVFAGKVVTAVDIAKQISDTIVKEVSSL